MNTMLPPSRDLPPGRHVEMRSAVLTAAGGRPARRRLLAPLVTAAAALAIVGLVAYAVPWGQGGGGTPGGSPGGSSVARTTETQAPGGTTETQATNGATETRTVNGVTPDEVAAIEQGCGQSATRPGAVLTQLLTDEAGRFALLYGDEYVLDCMLDYGSMPYNSGSSRLSPMTGPVSLDLAAALSGGDVPGGKQDYAGQHGYAVVAGRVAPEVARVTYEQDGQSVDAVLANGTYLARIVHPTDWTVPENQQQPVVRAYDKNGTLLGEIGS
jgi:hypothetical protein